MVKQSAVDRIEKALGNFKARVIRQQLGVLLFHPQKKIDVGTFPFGNAAQLLYHQANMVIVEMDTLLHRLLYGVPVSLFKALLRAGGHLQETPVLGVESL